MVSAVKMCSCFTSELDFNRFKSDHVQIFCLNCTFLKDLSIRHPCKCPQIRVKRELVQGLICWVQHKTSKNSCINISPRGWMWVGIALEQIK